MSDLASGVGFDASNLPSYEDLVKKAGLSDELEKASQVLQTATLTHSVLSNYKPYKALIKSLSDTIFDPIKAKFTQAVGEAKTKVVGSFNPTGEGNGISSKLLDLVGDNPQELLSVAKNPKALGKSLLNKTIEKSNIDKETQSFVKGLTKGKVDKNILESKLVPDEFKDITNQAKQFKDLPNVAKQAINEKLNQIPDETVNQLKAFGFGPDDIALQNIDTSKLQMPLKFVDPSNTVDAPDLGLEDAIKSYRASKYIDMLGKPETGALRGDSTIGRMLQGEIPTDIKGYVAKSGANIKQAVSQNINDIISQPINENRQLADEALNPYLDKLQSTASDIGTLGDKIGSVTKGVGESSSGISKTLQEATDQSLFEDEDPIGAGISAVLEIATLATMLGGIFAPKKQDTPVVGGYQSGI